MEELPRLTDLVPIRLRFFALALLAGVAIIAGLEALYYWAPAWTARTTDGQIAAFDLDTEGSLGAWFSSTVLLLAGLAAVLVYLIRRHRVDDYQGYYRVWLWAAGCCLLMSVDEGSSLHEGFKELMAQVTGTRLMGDGSIWWVVPYFFLLGAIGTRLVVDMRSCRLSMAAILGTAACFAVAVVTQLGWLLPESGLRGVMLEEGAEMLGDVLLLLAMALHARHVILEAQGLLPERKPKNNDDKPVAESPKKPSAIAPKSGFLETETEEEEEEEIEAEEEEESGRAVVIHPPHGIPRPATSAPAPVASASSKTAASTSVSKPAPSAANRTAKAAPTSPSPPASDSPRKLTKAERKAMKNRLAQMRAARDERLGG